MLAALAALSLALAPAADAAGPGNMSPRTLPEGPAPVALLHTAVAAEAVDGMPRYHVAPLTDDQWVRLAGKKVLLILGTAGRECVTLSKADKSAVYYVHEANGAQQAPRGVITAVHENSWECAEGREAPPAEWARVGAGVGVAFSAVGLAMGVLYDVGRAGKTDPGDYTIKHFMYAGLGLSTTLLGTPIVAIGGASTSRDLRVRGKIWARGLGYALYGGAVIVGALWLVGQYGDRPSLDFVGVTSLAGGLGLAGSAFMAYDALSSRAELQELQLRDTGGGRRQARRGQLRFGAGPLGQGFALALGGRF